MAFTGTKMVQPSRLPECHTFAFSTTDATVEIKTQLKVIQGYAFGLAGSPGSGEHLSIDETVSNFGDIPVPAGSSVTVKRAATTTSGLIGSVLLFGY